MIDNQRKAGSSHIPTEGVQQSAGDQHNKNNAGLPTISLPKGGGAIRGIGEKFAANPVTGMGSLTVPLAASPGRAGFGPQLALSHDSDVFILSGAEELVPELRPDGSRFEDPETVPGYTIHRYRPRIEGLFARI